jgi:hypothetical protein
MRSCLRIADKSVNVRIYRLGATPLDIRGALSLRTAALMNYSRILCSGTFRKISAKPTSHALYSRLGQPFAKRSARCRGASCICSAVIRREKASTDKRSRQPNPPTLAAGRSPHSGAPLARRML